MSVIAKAAFVALTVGCGLANYQLLQGRPDLSGITPGGSAAVPPRPFEPRLSVATNTGFREQRTSSAALVSFATHVRSGGGPTTLSARHISALIEAAAGDIPSAVSRLTELATQQQESPDAWLDLSAALLLEARANTHEPFSLYAASLNASLRAHSLRPSAAASFNAGLAWLALGLPQPAASAWEQALALEPDGSWRTEIRRRLIQLRRETHSRGIHLPSWERLGVLSDERLSEAVRHAPQPWREFLEDEMLPLWADQARSSDQRESVLRQAEVVAQALFEIGGDGCPRQIIDAVRSQPLQLSRALRLFVEGRRFYETSRREEAVESFRRALSEIPGQTALAVRINVHLANSLYLIARHIEAEALAAEVAADSRQLACWSNEAAAVWLIGIAQTRDGRVSAANASYERAAILFERTMQEEDRAAVQSSMANMRRVSGDIQSGWLSLGETLRGSPAILSPRRRYTVLLNASLFASDSRLPYAALAFQALSLEAARQRGAANTMVEALVRRAELLTDVGADEAADADLRLADDWMTRVESPASRRYQSSWLKLAKAARLQTIDPLAALNELDDVRVLFEEVEPVEVPRIHLIRARIFQRLGQHGDCEVELKRGIATQEARLRRFRDTAMAVSYQDSLSSLFDEYLDLLISQGRWPEAFQLSERARRLAADGRQGHESGLTAAMFSERVGGRSTALYFVSTATRVCRWTFGHGEDGPVCTNTSRDTVDAFVRGWRSSIATGAQAQPRATFLQQLMGSEFWLDTERPLLVIPDGSLHRLSFSALRHAESAKFLIQARPVSQTASASAALRGRRDRSIRGDHEGVLIVGQGAAPGLPRLPEVPGETSRIAAAYGERATVLLGSEATLSNTSRSLPVSGILHFAGHAEANPIFPWRSTLYFSPESEFPTGAVTAARLSTLRLDALRVVVLAACSTGDGGLFQGTGVVSLASVFLSAGVPAVVASLWDVDDTATSELLLEFHQGVARGVPVARALRDAQLARINSSDERDRLPRDWAAFVTTSSVETGVPRPVTPTEH